MDRRRFLVTGAGSVLALPILAGPLASSAQASGLIECPYDDGWTSNSADTMAVQLAQFLDHFEQKHSDQLPPAARAAMKACARELEKLPV